MTRFSAVTLDLSRIDRASIFPTLSFEATYQARMADLKARLAAAGIDYDVGGLETDTGAILQQSANYRELLASADAQDKTASVLLAWATGLHLDRLGDALRCERMAAVTDPRPFAAAPEDWESDDRYRARIQVAPEALSTAGTPGGYLYHTASVSTLIRDVGLTIARQGTPDATVEITILSTEGDGTPSAELLDAVRLRLRHEEIGLMTDPIRVRAARIETYAYAATLVMRAGPDPAIVKAAAERAIRLAADRYKRVGGDVPVSALDAAAYVAGVDEVIRLAPGADFRARHFQAAHLSDVTLRVEIDRG